MNKNIIDRANYIIKAALVDEQIDVLDAHMHKTGVKLPWKQVHDRELWHGAARLWIYNDKREILLQLRHPNVAFQPKRWDASVSGHMRSGDDAVATLVREAKEELGITVPTDKLVCIGLTCSQNRTPSSGLIHRICNWEYILKHDYKIEQLKLQPDEVSDAKWIPLSQFEHDVNDPHERDAYANRPMYKYDMAITEIRNRLG